MNIEFHTQLRKVQRKNKKLLFAEMNAPNMIYDNLLPNQSTLPRNFAIM